MTHQIKKLKMRLSLKFFIASILFVALTACECVPDIDTPKIISPENYSYAAMINAIPDRENLVIESDDIPLFYGVSYSGGTHYYQKINSANSFLRLIDSDSQLSLFNMPINLTKLKHYSIIFYGFRNSAKALIIDDEPAFEKNGAFFRIIHTAVDAQNFTFQVSGPQNFDFDIGFKSFSELTQIVPGNYNIKLINIQNQIVSESQFNIESNKIYNFVLKGTQNLLPSKPLFIDAAIINKEN
ncbi:MAG: DUF4397 domain-containing protein [Candidatus Kapabacteria bacterium]|nr:DUF4397 domain-containing protein [Ignavibacteriota bacterium]MCW5885219.1 DUF4397 domain-containing protein [Candidatus Kapabacteria bacterium]